MKTYRVVARSVAYLDKDIEAENDEQAWMIARQLDSDEFKYAFDREWDIFNVTELNKGTT